MNIPFHIPYISGKELSSINDAIQCNNLSSDGKYLKLCESKLAKITGTKSALLTSSCTHALEMCALLIDVEPGDEIIMSSFNFVSAANAFVLRGAKIVFVDIRPDTMNIDEELIESAITSKTKAIVAMHYGGVACEMNKITELADKYGLIIIEDAAHCIDSYYKNKHLGTIGHLGTISFHSTKNIHCGEGGVLLLNDTKYLERAEILREKGTNRKAFIKGQVDKYSWVDVGSSYIMSELNAAFLSAHLDTLKKVTQKHRLLWLKYKESLKSSIFETSKTKENHNGHIFHIKCQNNVERNKVIRYLGMYGIKSTFHYIPLHSSPAGMKYGRFHGIDKFTTKESSKILRLPMYYNLKRIKYISSCLNNYGSYKDNREH